MFRKLDCFRPSVKGEDTLLGLRYLCSCSYTDLVCPVVEVSPF
jgi:hypothetical protein